MPELKPGRLSHTLKIITAIHLGGARGHFSFRLAAFSGLAPLVVAKCLWILSSLYVPFRRRPRHGKDETLAFARPGVHRALKRAKSCVPRKSVRFRRDSNCSCSQSGSLVTRGAFKREALTCRLRHGRFRLQESPADTYSLPSVNHIGASNVILVMTNRWENQAIPGAGKR